MNGNKGGNEMKRNKIRKKEENKWGNRKV